ncbi:Uncharacterised protein [Mycobacteroides abscessus subsp. abscessus]|nr:Uncharacterised protein [Mycobacteroides abscessus subsp. abscessus]
MGEKRQYREHATVILVGVSQVQSAHDAVDMFLDGALGNPQPPSDSGIGQALGHQLQHFKLTLGQGR